MAVLVQDIGILTVKNRQLAEPALVLYVTLAVAVMRPLSLGNIGPVLNLAFNIGQLKHHTIAPAAALQIIIIKVQIKKHVYSKITPEPSCVKEER
jgi:hypothetical protein